MNMSEPLHFPYSPVAPLRGRLLVDEPMGRHLSWRTGGRATRAYVPADLADLRRFMATLPTSESILFVGLGSNLLVRDGGFNGTVVLMHDTAGAIRMDPRDEGNHIYAAAGVASPKLARFAATQGYEGAEFLAGIPGTVGGALAMNAGCYGAETWEVTRRAQMLLRSGDVRVREASEFRWSYRHVELLRSAATIGVDEWFLGGWFEFRRGDALLARERIKSLLAKRIASQPLNLPNAGSVFRNPPGDFAARLIEAAGLKGFAIGGARIAERHANFIVNPGGRGSAADIEALIEHAQAVVLSLTGIALVPEVRIVGEAR